MQKLLLTLMFDGTRYHGWQVQKNALAIQQVVQDALEAVLHTRPDLSGCSRTDAGVHANMYCCHLCADIDPYRLVPALNAHLPHDIAVQDARVVPEDFHARYSAFGKEYLYKIWNAHPRNPFLEGYALHYRRPLDLPLLKEQAAYFLGKHDFTSFCSVKCDVEDTVRTVRRLTLEQDGALVTVAIEADGFLYNMVRIIVGTLLFINEGRIAPGEIPAIFDARDRNRAGKTAPAHGLYLNHIYYGEAR